MTDQQWEPKRVTGMRRELAHEEEREKTLDRDLRECRERITEIKSQIARETGPQQATVNWGGCAE